MGFDGKYGQVRTEFGSIPDDEPVFLFRGRDALLLSTLEHYLQTCREAGCPDPHLLIQVDAIARIRRWQQLHADRVVTPSSSGEAGQTYFDRLGRGQD